MKYIMILHFSNIMKKYLVGAHSFN